LSYDALRNAGARDLERNGVVIEEMGIGRRDDVSAIASVPASARHLAERRRYSLSFLNPADAGPSSR
jgi:hypothetical protein